MRTVVLDHFGGPEVLQVVDSPAPTPGAGEVVVDVRAAGVNRADLLARAGRYHRAGQPPLVLGLEACGVVSRVGEGVDLAPGTRVVARGATNEPGFYREQAVVPAVHVVPVPDGVDDVSAASLPTAWLSAWYCLRRLGGAQPGQTVLVHAAASGVGSAAVQIAKAAGATVVATARTPAKTEWVRGLGADAVVDTASGDRAATLAAIAEITGGHGADVVLDTVGGDTFADSLKAAAYGGRVVALANVALAPSTIDTRDFYPRNIQILGFQITALMEHGYDPRDDLQDLLAGVAAKQFTVPIAATFDLADAGKAHELLASRDARGKVVLTTGR
jgi:NADPH:quinone reductase